jgi:hypothetical protein
VGSSLSLLTTYSGKGYDILDFSASDVDIRDIAHSLAFQCRFGGHCREFYSVAQHSVLVSKMCPEFALWGLLHDASEAYCFDIPYPLKKLLSEYKSIEDKIQMAVAEAFGLGVWPGSVYPPAVHVADKRMLATEERDICKDDIPWEHTHAPYDDLRINPRSPEVAKVMFINKFNKLTGEKVEVEF